MSEILGRTWSYLTSSGSGPKWSVPCNQSSSTAHLPHGLAQFMKAVMEAPTSVSEAEIVKTQINAIQMKLQEPNIKTSVLSDCIVRAMLCSILGYSVDFISINALQLAQKGSITEKKLGMRYSFYFLNSIFTVICFSRIYGMCNVFTRERRFDFTFNQHHHERPSKQE